MLTFPTDLTGLTALLLLRLFGYAILAVVFHSLYRIHRERHLRLWSWAWLAELFRIALELFALSETDHHPSVLGSLALLLSSLLFLNGTTAFLHRRPSPLWAVSAGAGVLWIAAAHLFRLSEFAETLPLFLCFGSLFVWTGLLFWRHAGENRFGSRLTGTALILWGFHKIDYPFLALVEHAPLWRNLASTLFSFTVAFGILLVYFQSMRRTLEEKEIRFRTIADYTCNWESWLNDAGRPLWINPAVETLTGYTVVECLALEHYPLDLILADDRPRVQLDLERLYSAGAAVATRFRLRRRDGEIRWMELVGQPVQGDRNGFRTSVHDVTEEVASAESVRTSREYYRTLLETVPHGIFECDLGGAITYVNPGFCSLWSVPPDAVLGRSFIELLDDAETRQRLSFLTRQFLTTSAPPPPLQIPQQSSDDRTLWRRLDWNFLRDNQGRATGALGIVTDITAQKNLEFSLQHTVDSLRALFDAAPQAVALFTPHGEIRQWNRCAAELFGWSAELFRHHSFASLCLTPDDRALFEQKLQGAFAGQTQQADLVVRHSSGELIEASLTLAPLLLDDAPPREVVAIFEDCRERKRVEQILRNSEETYRNLIETVPVAIFVHIDGFFVFANPAAAALFGTIDQRQLTGRPIADFLLAPERELFLHALDALADEPQPAKRFNLRIQPLTGGEREIEATFLNLDYNGCSTRMAICLDVTERNRSLRDLRSQAEFIRTMLDTIPSPIFYKDAQGVYLGCNRAFEEYLGKGRDEVVGRTVFDLAPPDLAQIYFQADADLLATGGTQSYETEVVFADGSRHDVLFNKATFSGQEGTPGGLIGTMLDISTRKAAEEALRASERKFHAIFDQAFQFSGLLDAEGRILEANNTSLEFIGASIAEVQGTFFWEAPWWAEFPEEQEKIRRAVTQGSRGNTVRFETLNRGRTGAHRCIDFSLKPVRNEAGEVIYLIPEGRDITERKAAEEALQESEASYRRLSREFEIVFNGISDSLTVWSRDQRLVWANRATSDFLDSGLHELTGVPCSQICPYDRCQDEECEIRACLATGKLVEQMRKSRDGRTWGIKTFPLFDDHGELHRVMRLASDLTERVRLREAASRSAHLAALGELAAGVAHEINNPTGLILLDMPVVRDALRDALPILEAHYRDQGEFPFGGLRFSQMRDQLPLMVDEIVEGAQRIKRIVEELKDFARPTGQEFERIDLNEVVRKALSLVGPQLRKATDRLEVRYGEDLPPVQGNFQRIEQVVVNLLMNAAQSLPDRTCGIYVTLGHARAGHYTDLVVRDEGVGIRSEHLAQITDPFFTTRREVGGTGLGLSVSSRIVQEHGGLLEFASIPGEGTTVTLSLPHDPNEE